MQFEGPYAVSNSAFQQLVLNAAALGLNFGLTDLLILPCFEGAKT